MKKKGFELSVNFFVSMILGLVLLGMGIYFAAKLYGWAMTKSDELDKQTQEAIRGLLSRGDKVVVYPVKETVRKGESKTFGLGVLNTYDNEEFYIQAMFSVAYDSEGNPFYPANEVGILMRANPWQDEIAKYNEELFSIAITVPNIADSGTHVVNIIVCHDNDLDSSTTDSDPGGAWNCVTGMELYDGSIHKIQVIVP